MCFFLNRSALASRIGERLSEYIVYLLVAEDLIAGFFIIRYTIKKVHGEIKSY